MQRESSWHPVSGITRTQAASCTPAASREHLRWITWPLSYVTSVFCLIFFPFLLQGHLLTSITLWVYSFESLVSLLMAIMLGNLAAVRKENWCKKLYKLEGQGGIDLEDYYPESVNKNLPNTSSRFLASSMEYGEPQRCNLSMASLYPQKLALDRISMQVKFVLIFDLYWAVR